MNDRIGLLLCTLFFTACTTSVSTPTAMSKADPSVNTMAVASAFLQAAGSGDMDTLRKLMADDFVWHNEGDSKVPWIGNWEGRDVVLNDFLPKFGAGLAVTKWTTDYQFAKGNQAVFMGTMAANANKTGKSTGLMSWAVRVHVDGDKVKSWNWFEDSYAVSSAYSEM